MGYLLLDRCIQAGHEVYFYDPFPAAQEKAMERRGKNCATPGDLAGNVECVIFFLPGPAEIQLCLLGEGGIVHGAAAGLIVVDMSTSSPQNTVAMARAAKDR